MGTGVALAGTEGWAGALRARATAWLTLRGLAPGRGVSAAGVRGEAVQVTRPQWSAAGGEA